MNMSMWDVLLLLNLFWGTERSHLESVCFLRQAPSRSAQARWSPSTTPRPFSTCWTPSQTRSYITSANRGARFSSSRDGRPSCSSCSPTSDTWGELQLKNVSLFLDQSIFFDIFGWESCFISPPRFFEDERFKRHLENAFSSPNF